MKNVEQMMIGEPWASSSSFKKFIKDIADSKTKYEESLVMQSEIESLKKEIKTPYASPNVQHERLVKLIYIHMLGYDATFGVIDAIKFVQQSSLFYKRVGYLVASLLLDPGREEALLLCCSMQKDLNSESVVEQSMALTAICQLMGRDTISVFLPTITRKLSHPKEIIRKKAIDVMYQFLCEQPEVTYDAKYQVALCDPDAGVMISTLPIYLKLTREKPEKYRHMIKAFTDILTQIVEGRLHSSFNYHTFPAPWAQLYLLQILHYLGTNDKESSSQMNHVLHLVVARASGKMTTPQAADAAIAVLYQVSLTVLSIYPDQDMILLVTRKIDELLNSSVNKVYLGLMLLYKLCEQQPAIGSTLIPQVYKYTTHECTMLREAAIQIIGVGVTADNITQSTDILLDVLSDQRTTEKLRSQCCETLSDIGRRLSPNPVWYVRLLIDILKRTVSSIDSTPSPILKKLVNYCISTEDPEVVSLVREVAADCTSDSQIAWLSIWALGRYETDFKKATECANRLDILSENKKIWYLDSVIVLITRLGKLPSSLYNNLKPYCNDPSPLIRQLAVEIINLSDFNGDPTSLFSSSVDAISLLVKELEKEQDNDLENTTAHKQFLRKFRTRVNVPADRIEFEVEPDESPRQRITAPSKDGVTPPTISWVSYHEHIPEEASGTEKAESPLTQPAIRTSYRWGNLPKQSHSGDPTRC